MAIHSRFWKIFDLVLLLIVIAIGVWAVKGYFLSKEQEVVSSSSLTAVEVTISTGNGETIQDLVGFDSSSSSATALSVLKMAAAIRGMDIETKDYAGMGTIVTKIGSDINGTGGAYWQFWINGQYADRSADKTGVSSGDRVEWKFSSSTQTQ